MTTETRSILYDTSGSPTLTNTKKYYAFGGQVVAMKDNGTLYYLHGDCFAWAAPHW